MFQPSYRVAHKSVDLFNKVQFQQLDLREERSEQQMLVNYLSV